MSRRKKDGDLMKLFSFRVPPKMIEEYRVFCDENCMDVSKRINTLRELGENRNLCRYPTRHMGLSTGNKI